MATPLTIDEMTIEEKLQTMEALWDNLCRNEKAVPVYDWQKDVLNQRERLIEEGKARFIDWEEAKARISKKTS
jgi:putative addiction module component (TIGR02574 family)